MKDFILVNFHPFSLMQDVSVYKDSKCIIKVKVNENQVGNTVKSFKNTYKISSVTLVGNNEYLKEYAKELKTDFNVSDIHIQEH